MRYDTVISFIRVKKEYNPDTSEDTVILESLISYQANVYDLGSEEELKLFGTVTNTHKSVIILGEFTSIFDYIMVGEDFFKLNSSIKFRNKQYFTIEKVADVVFSG